jgi:cephalosporin hydroxylase
VPGDTPTLVGMMSLNDPTVVEQMGTNPRLRQLSLEFIRETLAFKYSYGFSWLGRPIIQFPQDVLAVQEIIWRVQPDLIIETGVAHGGSLILSASILELIGRGQVLGIDIEIRPHNREALASHPLAHRISLIEGSSTDQEIAQRVKEAAAGKHTVLVLLDSNHTHEHVLAELKLYAPLVSIGSYIIVFDTIIEDLPEDAFPDRPWGKGNNPRTAVWKFMDENDVFIYDREVEHRLLITVAADGYLRRVR